VLGHVGRPRSETHCFDDWPTPPAVGGGVAAANGKGGLISAKKDCDKWDRISLSSPG
jgi:hypothetical protein